MARVPVDAVDVTASIERRRVVLKSWFAPAVDDYTVPISFVVAPFIVDALNSNPVLDAESHSRTIVLLFVLLAALATHWTYASYHSYRLVRFDVLGTQDGLLERVIEAVEELDWSVMEEHDDLVIAYNRANFFSTGQVITVIVQPNALYLNSRNRRGPKHRSPYSFGRDAKNVRMLRRALGLEGNAVQSLEP